ncbi:MAG: PQQ-like beta-propeller repeat protein [Marinibacterium sp.]|nr:PQQ-like beta-propeller repeat protein [Marinibacterium sp.]
MTGSAFFKLGSHRRAVLTLGVAALLSACAQPDVILPGAREAVDPARDDSRIFIDATESRPIRLPSATRNASWEQGFGTPAFRTDNPALAAQPSLVWSTRIGQGDSRRQRIVATPMVGGGRVYTLDAVATLSATSQSGAPLWSVDLTPSDAKSTDATGGGIAYADGTVYVSLGFGEVIAVDATSGGVRWRQRIDGTGSGQPTVSGGILYLVSGDQTGWAIDAKSGRVLWQLEGGASAANVLGAPAPAISSKFALFAFGSGEVAAAFKTGGVQRWSANISGARAGVAVSRYGDLTGEPVIVGNTVYVGNQSGRLVALDLDSGTRRWTLLQGTAGPVWPAGDSVFAITDTAQLIRVDAASGDIIWAKPLPGFVKENPRKHAAIVANYGPVMAGGRLRVVSGDGLMRSFDPTNGALLGTVEIPDGASTRPSVAGGTLYVVSRKGDLHAFR